MMVKEASRIMGKSDQFVRIGLQRNLLPFRTALQISIKNILVIFLLNDL